MKNEDLWIFAYGSLCWQPGFEYEEMVVGHIKGWIRRFWQGNQVHRGTAEKPGRVATLVPDQDGETYGCAYRVNPQAYQKTLKYLDNRETKLGGYDSKRSLFYPCDDGETEPFLAILYIALPGNVDWRGPGDLENIADEVITASGVCGSNIAYVTDLAAFLRAHEFKDDHVFELEAIVLEKMREDSNSSSVSVISEDEEEGSDSLESSIE